MHSVIKVLYNINCTISVKLVHCCTIFLWDMCCEIHHQRCDTSNGGILLWYTSVCKYIAVLYFMKHTTKGVIPALPVASCFYILLYCCTIFHEAHHQGVVAWGHFAAAATGSEMSEGLDCSAAEDLCSVVHHSVHLHTYCTPWWNQYYQCWWYTKSVLQ